MFEYSTRNPDIPVAYSSGKVMHTLAEILLPHLTEADARIVTDEIWDLFRSYERRFNRFDKGSILADINRRAANESVAVDEETYMILEMCRIFCQNTDGCFDITANTASRSSHDGPANYILDAEHHTIRFADDSVRLDLGGFAKGYAMEQVQRLLVRHGINCGIINLGNSTTLALGAHPYGTNWPVSVEHPYYPGRQASTFPLLDSALSISGRNGQGQAHIIDPYTGDLIDRPGFIAVTGRSPLVVEVLSTALYVCAPEQRPTVLQRFPGYEGTEIICRTDGTVTNLPITG